MNEKWIFCLDFSLLKAHINPIKHIWMLQHLHWRGQLNGFVNWPNRRGDSSLPFLFNYFILFNYCLYLPTTSEQLIVPQFLNVSLSMMYGCVSPILKKRNRKKYILTIIDHITIKFYRFQKDIAFYQILLERDPLPNLMKF
jgi:hypothetical protein